MEELVLNNNTYRIKQMNAIEVLSIQSTINFDDIDKIQKCYSNMLEKIEVKVKDQWVSVKSGNNFYPIGIENDVKTIEELIKYFLSYLRMVFQNSKE